jgi:hypothetical protein
VSIRTWRNYYDDQNLFQLGKDKAGGLGFAQNVPEGSTFGAGGLAWEMGHFLELKSRMAWKGAHLEVRGSSETAEQVVEQSG